MTPQVAVVGAGYWGKNLIRNFQELGALRVICDSSPPLLESYAAAYPNVERTTSFADLLADGRINAVVIATPAVTHSAVVKAALQAGKDVFVEKPLALCRAEGEELVTLAEKQGRLLMVGHILQYHPAVHKLKELVDRGELGKIQYIYSHRLNIGKIRTEENILWSFAPHDISVILKLLGESPDHVAAHGGNYLHHGVADVTMTTLSFASGVRGHIFVSWLHPIKEQRLVVVGEKKMVVFNDADPQHKLVAYAHHVEWIDRKPVAKKAEPQPIPVASDEPLRLECAHFLECIASRQTPRTDGREGLAVLAVLEACQKSLDTGGASVALRQAAAPRYFVHESSYVDEGCEIGEGTKIWHFSHILKGSKIGANCNIGQNVVIGPRVTIGIGVKIQNNVSVYTGVTLEDDVFCGPSMVFTNVINPRSAIRRMDELKPTLVKKGASIGANATIVCGHTIGRYAFIGAGAVVTKDVPDYALVVGNPGRVVGWMCGCGVRLGFAGDTTTCTSCGTRYAKNGHAIQPQP
ncbi:MAG: Gfo/Idh/MocA family oxidoreductase [Chloroflexi bacterium]|nr:Gfo/Idh/MocA family oxidoreductase [Chloroflexota bacterium]